MTASPWPATGYSPMTRFNALFGRSAFADDPTLLLVLVRGGGYIDGMSRQAVAALLNAGHPGTTPNAGLETEEQVIGLWQVAYDSRNAGVVESVRGLFASSNAAACVAGSGTAIAQQTMPDTDGDKEYDPYDNCALQFNRNQEDIDLDGVGDACDEDSDGDGCDDMQELGADPQQGGRRDPSDRWDYYDITGDRRIDLTDALRLLDFYGDEPGQYDPALDRVALDLSEPWRTSLSTDGIDLTDALTSLSSFGHSCAPDP